VTAELGACPHQLYFDGRLLDQDKFGYLINRHAIDLKEYQDSPVLLGEVVERLVESFRHPPPFDLSVRSVRGTQHRIGISRRRPNPILPDMVRDNLLRDAKEPSAKARFAPERRESPVDDQEDFLDDVFNIRLRASQSPGPPSSALDIFPISFSNRGRP
jgi:hypothetical protein